MAADRPVVERRHPPAALVRFVNPLVRQAVERGALARHLLVLHLTGRRSGRQYDIPVGHRTVDGQLVVLTDSAWRHNLAGGADVEVTLDGRRRPARAVLVEDADAVADLYDRLFRELGLRPAQRRLGVAVHVERLPTKEELRELVRRTGLSAVQLHLQV